MLLGQLCSRVVLKALLSAPVFVLLRYQNVRFHVVVVWLDLEYVLRPLHVGGRFDVLGHEHLVHAGQHCLEVMLILSDLLVCELLCRTF